MHRIARLLGWLALATLVFVTVVPIGLRPVSGAPVSLERLGAFAVLGFLFAFGYSKRPVRVLALVIIAAAGLEAFQLLEATRHGRMADFLVKAAGGGIGVAIGSGLAALPALRRGVEAEV
ncbi:hypothetical protein ASF41_23355 [Methylobacterium sp. Leaf111]|uniref:hypothetical protein n=1 Tax=Methylobacterium sp. Leaf111 TaxID=1736257 RepID=UPI0007008312|nr:hypothetical protein [Methylobacterium sp. Leaf111]KQP53612.1 hypothetical protein ASF41_23355 [Methylobacterium sp. Leaf111]